MRTHLKITTKTKLGKTPDRYDDDEDGRQDEGDRDQRDGQVDADVGPGKKMD